MAQITAHVLRTELEEFQRYAASFGLDASALASLLLIRELRVGRLGRLAERDLEQRGLADATITAHQSDDTLKVRWIRHAKDAGLSTSRSSALIFRAELSDRWLERIINQVDSN